MTRAEYHADSPASEVKRSKRVVARALFRATDRDSAVSSTALARATGWREDEPNVRDTAVKPTTIRDEIKELRRDEHLPVVSCSQGYYLIDDTDALERELDRIAAEIQTRRETRQELVRAFNRTVQP